MTEKADKSLKESLSALVDGETGELELRRILKQSELDNDSVGNHSADKYSPDKHSVRRVWRRYQLMGAAMRGELRGVLKEGSNVDLSTRIFEAIEKEDAHEVITTNPGIEQPSGSAGLAGEQAVHVRPWYVGAGQTAVAAMVAFAVLIGVNQFAVSPAGVSAGDQFANSEIQDSYPASPAAIVPEGYRVPSLNAMTVSSTPGERLRPQSFVSTPALVNGSHPVRVVADQEMQEQLQRMLFLHAEKASEEAGLRVVPFSRISRQDNSGE